MWHLSPQAGLPATPSLGWATCAPSCCPAASSPQAQLRVEGAGRAPVGWPGATPGVGAPPLREPPTRHCCCCYSPHRRLIAAAAPDCGAAACPPAPRVAGGERPLQSGQPPPCPAPRHARRAVGAPLGVAASRVTLPGRQQGPLSLVVTTQVSVWDGAPSGSPPRRGHLHSRHPQRPGPAARVTSALAGRARWQTGTGGGTKLAGRCR